MKREQCGLDIISILKQRTTDMFLTKNITPHQRIQFHILRSFPASNLNRDESGKPKEVMIGGKSRLRISSQSQKYAIRHSEVFDSFRDYASKTYGCKKMVRTTHVYRLIMERLITRGLKEDMAAQGAMAIFETLKATRSEVSDETGSIDELQEFKESRKTPAKPMIETDLISQIIAVSEDEIDSLVEVLAGADDQTGKDWARKIIAKCKPHKQRAIRERRGDMSPEIQLFGRMVTSDIFSDVQSPLQVGHAFTVHKADVERDYWTSSDDIKVQDGKNYSALVDVRRYGAGLFYQYFSLDVDMLHENLKRSHLLLDRDQLMELTIDTINALSIALITQSPIGGKNSYASQSLPSHILIEQGTMFPFNAASAFEAAVTADESGYFINAKNCLQDWIKKKSTLYPPHKNCHSYDSEMLATQSLDAIIKTMASNVQKHISA